MSKPVYTEELCTVCKQPATHKIGEEFASWDPRAMGHNLTGNLCDDHFDMVIRPYEFKKKHIPTKGMVLEILSRYNMLPDPTDKHFTISREQKVLEEINDLFNQPADVIPKMSAIQKLRSVVEKIIEVSVESSGEYSHGRNTAAHEIFHEMNILWPETKVI